MGGYFSEPRRASGERGRPYSRLGFDFLRCPVPPDHLSRAQRGVRDVRRARGLVANLDVRVRLRAAADAIQPVLKMRQRAVAARPNVDVGLRRQRSRSVRRIVTIEGQARAVDLQGAFLAAEFETA